MKTIIKGHAVSYEPSANAGVRYLTYDLDASEANVFFNQSFNRGSADFEDKMGNDYKLIHHGSEYQLVKE